MENPKQQLVDRIKSATNVLVTVGRNPSVDALSALLGLTLVLNKQGKHAAAVFSGQVPSTLEFLQPEETIEKNTDSLRDFIIALDKNKADKLRYKVEDNVVRIFITPYKTSISQEDFEFSEGDFNIDVVIALGVRQQEDLDEAITAHGRILHDATVATINLEPDSGLGSINWYEPQASSLSELVTELTQIFGPNLLDEQIATALLTGIVAETERFSNDKTSSMTMSLSATLMKAGANQQLVASKLDGQLMVNTPDLSDESKGDNNATPTDQSSSGSDGTIRIDHTEPSAEPEASGTLPSDPANSAEPPVSNDKTPPPEIERPDEAPPLSNPALTPEQPPVQTNSNLNLTAGPKIMTEPPVLGGQLTANSATESDIDPVTDPTSMPNRETDQILDRKNSIDDVKAPDLSPLPPANDVPAQTPSSSPPQPAPPDIPAFTPPTPTPTFTPAPASWTSPPAAPASAAPPLPSWTPPPAASVPTPSIPPQPSLPATPPAPAPTPLGDTKKDEEETLADIEQAVASSHVQSESVDAARSEVSRAYNDTAGSNDDALPAIDALNAQQLGGELHPSSASVEPTKPTAPTDSAPPPVPPPIPFQFGNPPTSQ